MKLPSLSNLFKKSMETAVRFPLTILYAIVSTCIAMILVDYHQLNNKVLINLLHSLYLGFLLSIPVTVLCEIKKLTGTSKVLANALVVVLTAGYYFYLPPDPGAVYYLRSATLMIAFHLLTSFIAYIESQDTNAFWQYNKTLFLQILTSAFFTGVLYIGLALALTAIHFLFDVDIKGETYARLWFFLAGVFNTWFFLSGVPENLNELEEDFSYPKGLKIFTQFVLLPIISIYLLILYFYIFKIILNWQLPKGWVSYLVLGFSVSGILSLLLVYPIQDKEENTWIKIYSRGFYWALFPLILMLFVAIGVRIKEHGVTENRYFILLLAFWLLGISIYLLINKLRNIKIIPMSLFAIAFLCSFGPWGAFYVSRTSQMGRLKNLLLSQKILVNGKVKAAEKAVDFTFQKKVSSILFYLVEMHGVSSVQSIFSQNLDTIKNKSYPYEIVGNLMSVMKLKYVSPYDVRGEELGREYFSFYQNTVGNAISISGYDYAIDFQFYLYSDSSLVNNQSFDLADSTKLQLNYQRKQNKIQIIDKDTLHIDLAKVNRFVLQNYKGYNKYESNTKRDSMTVFSQNKTMKAKLIFTNYDGYYLADKKYFELNTIQGQLLFARMK